MATSTKRPLPAKVQAMKARKRIKATQAGHGDDVAPSASRRKRNQVQNLEGLHWKDVDLPDRMDDYEGFLGLEELDGVEVLRDEDSGKVHYFTDAKSKTSWAKQSSSNTGDITSTDMIDTGDDWAGFDDDAPSTPQTKVKTSRAAAVSKSAAPILKKSSVSANTTAETTAQGSTFEVLEQQNDPQVDDVSAWLSLKLSPDVMAALSRLHFSKPTPIQTSSIPLILDGRDVIGKASTGSGKTLAFGIPLVERFLEERASKQTSEMNDNLALVLSPTRELAHQIEQHLSALCSSLEGSRPAIACLTGGLSLQKQQRLLKTSDIIVATPGRLWELIGAEKGLSKSLQAIRFLVLDEADRLLSEGHFKEVEEILNVLERKDDDPTLALEHTGSDDDEPSQNGSSAVKRQTLVFSATFDKSLQKKLLGKGRPGGDLMSNKDSMEWLLSRLNFQDEPQFVDVNPIKQLATGLREGLIECGGMEKDLYLYSILLHHQKSRAMVFTNSISAVRRITPFLQNLSLPVIALHSGMPQKARLRSVERLAQASAQNKGAVLIATDVAARGLDIPNVQLVIHYHLPRTADMYVHRSGRTARAGQLGSSIIICSPEEAGGVRKLIAKVHAQHIKARKISTAEASRQGYYIRTLDPDRKIVARLKPRATLAKKLADITIAKEKQHKEDEFLHAAAEELGVDYDSDEFQKQAPGRSGRGSGRKQKEKQAQSVSKAEAASMRAELRRLLEVRVNVGVSETYITSGRVDVEELLEQQDQGVKTGEFLGTSSGFSVDA